MFRCSEFPRSVLLLLRRMLNVDEMYLGNFRKDNDEFNVRLKLWSKTADLFTHKYYELRQFVTEF
jgi:hypothetical protein